MSDNGRPRDDRARDHRREPRDRAGTPSDRRNRSRSPRRDRGAPRRENNTRYRSRSPFHRDEGGRADRGRGSGGGGGARGRDDRYSTRAPYPDRDRNRARSPPKGPRGANAVPLSRTSDKLPSGPRGDVFKKEDSPSDTEMKEERQKPEGVDDDDWEMMCTMGFGGFKSTKNTKVPGNDKNFGVRKDKKMEARQYMNRQGGFNRPLSPSRG
ncbi:hypothetical protein IAQ61_002021 [Plenodomus lingam]|uniref:U4/U6.U5 small nuclear ribonucleoprotein 27kDa protein domain-containing protein n=1 Tax=Leptosphaeria maculans (strain JN3 / isolate v23.1.3 / race Av1-4-5-6-7-8) TaxID=985895 RepID=E4ZGV2_LEPMJ|nr:hypothetical protein LEMA_P066480.1 [Plenodomus lingam JN3]KAH9878747.1 hypothetical protein IAQ61_002021 [Plenodomus lingam]CBX90522.1 hypothetical protein LEMA_P066480.1 [Plenodomus lingam JN3]